MLLERGRVGSPERVLASVFETLPNEVIFENEAFIKRFEVPTPFKNP